MSAARADGIPEKAPLDFLYAAEVNQLTDAVNEHADELDQHGASIQTLLQRATGKTITALALPQAVVAGQWYVTATAIWEARQSFNAAADPAAGAYWLLIATFAGQAESLPASGISDATAAGRAMLTAESAAAQRALINNPKIQENQYGTHPAFTATDNANGLYQWLIQSVLAVAGAVAPAPGPAPTVTGFLPATAAVGASVTLTGKLFTGATSVSFNGTAASFQVINATTIQVVVPQGATTGPISVSNESATGTSAANFTVGASSGGGTTPALTAALALSLAQITLGGSVGYSITSSGGTAPYSYAVTATDVSTGATFDLGTAKSGTWQPPAVDQYAIDSIVTDAAGKVVATATRYLNVVAAANRIPVADAGSDVTIQLPTNSAALMGTASDPDQGDTLTYAWRQITGPNTAAGLPATTLNVVVSGLIAGTYQFGFRSTDNHGGQSTEDYVLVTVQADSTAPLKVLFLHHGTSLEQADQATLNQYGQGYPLHTGTNAIQSAQGAVGNTGRASSAEQLEDLWNAEGNNISLKAVNLGYPGKDVYYFERHILSQANSGFNAADYDYIVHCLAYAVNSVEPDQPNDSTDPADVLASLIRCAKTLIAPNPTKYLAFVALPANRIYKGQSGTDPDTPLYVNFNDYRLMFSGQALQQLGSFAKGADNIYEYPLGLANVVNGYPNARIVDGVHWTYLGQTDRAKSLARMLARYFGQTLSFGNGTTPVVPPTVGISITPASGDNTVTRTAVASTSAAYTKAELFRIDAQGISYPATLINSGNNVTFTPGFSARFYFRLTLTDGSFAYSLPSPLVNVTNSSGGGTLIETAVWRNLNKVDANSDFTQLTTSGGGTSWDRYATATRQIPKLNLDGARIEFPSIPRRAADDATGIMLSVATSPLPTGLSNALASAKLGFYSDGGTLRRWINGQYNGPDIAWVTPVGGQTSLAIGLSVSGNTTTITLYDGQTPVSSVDFTDLDNLYVYATANSDGFAIPLVRISATGLTTW